MIMVAWLLRCCSEFAFDSRLFPPNTAKERACGFGCCDRVLRIKMEIGFLLRTCLTQRVFNQSTNEERNECMYGSLLYTDRHRLSTILAVCWSATNHKKVRERKAEQISNSSLLPPAQKTRRRFTVDGLTDY